MMKKNIGNSNLPGGSFNPSRQIIEKYSSPSGKKALILLEHENQVRDCLQWRGELQIESRL